MFSTVQYDVDCLFSSILLLYRAVLGVNLLCCISLFFVLHAVYSLSIRDSAMALLYT